MCESECERVHALVHLLVLETHMPLRAHTAGAGVEGGLLPGDVDLIEAMEKVRAWPQADSGTSDRQNRRHRLTDTQTHTETHRDTQTHRHIDTQTHGHTHAHTKPNGCVVAGATVL